MMKDSLLFSGSSNIPLARRVADKLHVALGRVDLTRFADGEIRPWIQDDVRGKNTYVLQSLSNPMDEHIMELVLMGDAIRRSAPKSLIAVIPYMGYARQDKQHRTGEPISARVIAKFIEISKFNEVITVDLHNEAIVGFFQIPVIHISALEVLARSVQSLSLKHPVIVSPDVGGVKRARNLAYRLDIQMVVMEKKRYLDRHDESEHYQIIGDIKGKDAVIIDDIISSGGTIAHGSSSLVRAGASSVTVVASHAVFSGLVKDNLTGAPVTNVIVTDTIAVPKEKYFDRLRVVSTASVLADAILKTVRQ